MLRPELTWTHYRTILPIKNENEQNYYINQVILNNLSVRDLQKEIKNKSFDRPSYADKNNIEIINEKNNTNISIKDMIKDPVLFEVKTRPLKPQDIGQLEFYVAYLDKSLKEIITIKQLVY